MPVQSVHREDPLEKEMATHSSLLATFSYSTLTFLMVQMVKNLPVIWEIQVRSLGQEDTLEKGVATYSSILA